jgi:hypothetical protein
MKAKLVKESLNEFAPQYADNPLPKEEKTRKGGETKFRVWVFVDPLNITKNKRPFFVWVENPELYDSIRKREPVYFNGKPVPTSLTGKLVPYVEYFRGKTKKNERKPWFIHGFDWKGRDKFGGKKINPESEYIMKNGVPFSSYIS